MKHPNQEALALYAGGDLGFFARRRMERHLSQCDVCGEEVASFRAVREIVTDLNEMPELQWSRLAAEMRANIRLGIAAGECVRTETPLRESRGFLAARAAVAFASIVVLLAAGLILQGPTPARADQRTVLQPIAGGIQIGEGGSAFRLLNTGAKNVTFSIDAQGSVGARYVDPSTGYVTINNVYAE